MLVLVVVLCKSTIASASASRDLEGKTSVISMQCGTDARNTKEYETKN